jgi:hypothetical protein
MPWGFAVVLALAFSAPVVGAVAVATRSDTPAAATISSTAEATTRAAPRLERRRFDGTTGQQKHIGFRLSSDGQRIDHLSVTYAATCNEAISLELDDKLFTPIPVRPDGSFSRRLGNRITISGTIVGKRATGVFRVRMDYGIFTCRSPAIRWSAGG